MNVLRRIQSGLTSVHIAERTALIIAGVSTLVFLCFSALWLWLSTENVALLAELEQLEQRQIELQEQSNALWVEIGNETSPRVMIGRARSLGFGLPEEREVLPEVANR